MREKIGALIQFLAVIVSFAMLLLGIGGAYNSYFGADGAITSSVISETIVFLVIAIFGLIVGIVGIVVGNELKGSEERTLPGMLPTKKGLLRYILFNIVTLGVYHIVIMTCVASHLNIVASKHDGRKTMNFCLVYFVFSTITFGIVGIVWYHKLSARIGTELQRRNIEYSFGAKDYWLWNVLGSFICVGPYIYIHKLFKASNMLCDDYNKTDWVEANPTYVA